MHTCACLARRCGYIDDVLEAFTHFLVFVQLLFWKHWRVCSFIGQEEIRFAICPELCVTCLLCEVMRTNEAIQVLCRGDLWLLSGTRFMIGEDQSCNVQ